MSAPSSAPASGSATPTGTNVPARHAQSATDKQRMQLERLLRDPAKPVHIPAAPQQKGIRPAREMMKNVQGSSAGAGSGEFHVYKASRRREYERLKLMEEEIAKETIEAEFKKKKDEWEAQADAKTAKNRAKRQKKKERAKAGPKGGADKEQEENGTNGTGSGGGSASGGSSLPLKKRRLVNGTELVFRKPGEQEDDEDDAEVGPPPTGSDDESEQPTAPVPVAAEAPRIVIHDD